MRTLSKKYIDILVIVFIGVITSFITAFYLKGEILVTGYPDWMYHAYRALSIQQHGFLSWDSIWNSGIDYWRGYQWVAAATTAALSTIAHVSITHAMLILTVACFAAMHITTYIAARTFGIRRSTSLGIIGLLLCMTHYWVIVGFYSTMFAAVCVPLMLSLWKLSSTRPALRPLFALCVGLSFFIHPLLALSSFGLWLIGILVGKKTTIKETVTELIIITLGSFFYWYSLVLISPASPDPYQLSSDFLYIVAGVFQFPIAFYVVGALLLVGAIFRPAGLSRYSQYLFWYTAVIFVLCLLNIHTDVASILNRFQIYRLGFFITPVILILFGEYIQYVWPKGHSKLFTSLALITFAAGCTQALIYTSVYGYVTKNTITDPVTLFFKSHPAPTGTVYINDATTASYNNPNLRFNNGYNNQLLPQHVNLRFSDLLSNTAPNYKVSSREVTNIQNYAKVLGIQYIFLPQTSPYVQPLLAEKNFKLVDTIKKDGYDEVVLAPNWKITNAAIVDCNNTSYLLNPTFPKNLKSTSYATMDAQIQNTAEQLYGKNSTFLTLLYPSKDSLSFKAPKSSGKLCIVLNQSYATNWTVTHASMQSTSYGMMFVTVKAGNGQTIQLKHTWGYTIYIELGSVLVALILTIATSYTIRRRLQHE